VIFKNSEGDVYTGRCMDWFNETGTDLFVFPRGMKRDGGTSGNTLQWTSKYGSVISSFDNVATADGMNEKGLVANLLYLSDADFGLPGDKPTLNIAAWTQYVLDNYATVAEAVAVLEKDPFRIVAPLLKGGVPTTCHLSISDATGDSAIFEFIERPGAYPQKPEHCQLAQRDEGYQRSARLEQLSQRSEQRLDRVADHQRPKGFGLLL
jgi:choloylglycine hydrolase